jgi:hypothetical protein
MIFRFSPEEVSAGANQVEIASEQMRDEDRLFLSVSYFDVLDARGTGPRTAWAKGVLIMHRNSGPVIPLDTEPGIYHCTLCFHDSYTSTVDVRNNISSILLPCRPGHLYCEEANVYNALIV